MPGSNILGIASPRTPIAFFGSTTLPQASTIWVRLTLSSLCPLSQARPLINHYQIIFGNAENRTWNHWVRSENAIHCATRPPAYSHCLLSGASFTLIQHQVRETFKRSGSCWANTAAALRRTQQTEIYQKDKSNIVTECIRLLAGSFGKPILLS